MSDHVIVTIWVINIFFVQFFCVFLPPFLSILVSIVSLKRSLVFLILVSSSISLYCLWRKTFLPLILYSFLLPLLLPVTWNWQESHQFLRTTYTLAPFRPTSVTKLTFPKKIPGAAAITKTHWRSRAQPGKRCSSEVSHPPPQSVWKKKKDDPKGLYRINDTPEVSHGSPWVLGKWNMGKFTSLLSVSTLPFIHCFPHSSVGKESACNARDPGSIPGLVRSPGEGIGYPLQYSWASLVSQLVKNRPAMWETWVQSLGWKDPLEKERLPTPVFWPGEFQGLNSPWGRKESDMTERLSLFTFTVEIINLPALLCRVLCPNEKVDAKAS